MLLVLTTLLATFLYQNYRQALWILENGSHMSIAEKVAHCKCQDIPQYLQEELLYLNSLEVD